ncbi:hypothetical protein [Nocardiopsis sp. YSL2]|uniref:hypothetical protein n=1 Tax=Nocardiopsis sp. YSL2 TaxID=2939492 RepID=UPI0026F46A27|nr:hypothetical protein [Nocardiopsis sp. YSL2]
MTRKYLVVGKQPVLGRRRGQFVYLEDEHGDRLTRGGHVTPEEPDPPMGDTSSASGQDAPPPAEPDPGAESSDSAPDPGRPPRRKTKTTTKPRQSPGLSHVPDPADTPADDSKE